MATKKKHVFTRAFRTEKCEDCSGHAVTFAVCSCGWEKRMGYSSSEVEAKQAHLEHRLSVLEEA